MKTIDIITNINTYLKTEDRVILETLLKKLDVQYREEEAKSQGGNTALKRLRVVNKILKAARKDERYPEFHKCFAREINNEKYQLFGCVYYFIALRDPYRTTAEEYTLEEQKNFKRHPEEFFDQLLQQTLNKVDFDIMEIKKSLEQFKAEQKLLPPNRRNPNCILPIGNVEGIGFNAEYFINIVDVLGADSEFYQNENPTGLSYFKSSIGMAILCPVRLNRGSI